MRRILACLAIAICLPVAPAAAGAWLREAGRSFLSYTIKLQKGITNDRYATVYYEHGINPDLTIGLDLGGDELGSTKALAYALMPLRRDGLQVTFELGAGAVNFEATLRPGLSIGQDWSLGSLSGWWTVDTRGEIAAKRDRLAIDTTLGVNLTPRDMLIGQLQHGGTLMRPDTLRATASLVREVGSGRHIELGGTFGLINAEERGLKLGIWHSF